MRFGLAVAGATCAALLAGCGSGGYYMVREPGSAAAPYYTTDISTSGSALKFKDAKTGNAVTLQSSEVKKITKDEFTKGMTAPAASIATPVPAATVGAQSPAATPLPAGAGATAPAAVPIPAENPPAKPQ